jgi:hypothetical protein
MLIDREYSVSVGKNFLKVGAAFENNYECIGMTCEDITGIYDADIGGYLGFPTNHPIS